MELQRVGDDGCRRCWTDLPVPVDGSVGAVEPQVCASCAADLVEVPITVTGTVVVLEAAGLPELGAARLVVEWLDMNALVEPIMPVWVDGPHVPEMYALALGGHALSQALTAVVTVRPATGTAHLEQLRVT